MFLFLFVYIFLKNVKEHSDPNPTFYDVLLHDILLTIDQSNHAALL